MSAAVDTIYCGDSLTVLQTLPENSIDCAITSPPYYALRDYGGENQIGREATPEEYIDRLVSVFHEVKRVLAPQGTFWLNVADTYCGVNSKGESRDPKYPNGRNGQAHSLTQRVKGCKPKDLIGVPWLLALALRDDGWYLRSSIIWHKANPMPESTRDRPSRCYEYVFLLTKSRRYYYDWQAIAEPIAPNTVLRMTGGRSENHKYAKGIPGQGKQQQINNPRTRGAWSEETVMPIRNKRDVWQINLSLIHI